MNKVNNKSGLILVCDDEKVIVDVITRMLKRLKYSVLSTFNGEDAISVYQKRHKEIDLVILDVLMPKMDGIRVFMEIRKIDELVPVLFSTGYSDLMINRCLSIDKKNFNLIDYIIKPYTISELSKKVSEIIN